MRGYVFRLNGKHGLPAGFGKQRTIEFVLKRA